MSTPLPDLYLSGLNALTDEVDDSGKHSSFGITVTSDGTVFSGKLVSESLWLESVSNLLKSSHGAGQQALVFGLSKVKEATDGLRSSEQDSSLLKEYLHLVDASILSGGQITQISPVRVDLSSVTAWFFGIASKN